MQDTPPSTPDEIRADRDGWSWLRSFQCLRVGQILQSPGGNLVLAQVLDGDERNLQVTNGHTNTLRIGLVERQTGGRCEDVDSVRLVPELNHCIWLLEIVRAQSNLTKSEVSQSGDDSLCVALIGPNPNVEILRLARVSVSSDRITADDHEPNVMCDEVSDKLFEVVVQIHRSTRGTPCGSLRPLQCARIPGETANTS